MTTEYGPRLSLESFVTKIGAFPGRKERKKTGILHDSATRPNINTQDNSIPITCTLKMCVVVTNENLER